MNTDRLEALLWARIDGTIEPEELDELEAHLAEGPATRDIERQITTIAEELDHLEPVEPPAELRRRIDDALAKSTAPKVQTAPKTRPHSAPTWQARWLPLAASLLIGVAVGYLLHPGAGGSIDRSEVTGTMIEPPGRTEIAPVEIHLPADAGRVVASRAGADVVIDVILMTDIELGVTLAGTAGPVRFEGLNSTDASTTDVTTEHGWVSVRSRGPGTVTLAVSASDLEDPVRLQVSADGQPAEERWIGSARNELQP